MAKRLLEYRVLMEFQYGQTLQEQMERLIALGWEPIGGVSFISYPSHNQNCPCQAVIRKPKSWWRLWK